MYLACAARGDKFFPYDEKDAAQWLNVFCIRDNMKIKTDFIFRKERRGL